MKPIYFFIATIGYIVGWNVFLIQRDQQLFEFYNQPPQLERMK